MLVFGLGGSALLLLGDHAAVVGLVCLFLYYVCDCVDGEVARYHGREELVWSFHDYFFHLFVKSAFFLCMGIAAFRTVWETWIFVPAFSALLATLLVKFLAELPLAIAGRQVVLRPPREHERYLAQLVPDLEPGPEEPLRADPADLGLASLGRPAGVLRAALTNFDLAVLLFLVAAIADLFVPRFPVVGEPWNLKVCVLCFYGVVLPLDFLDRYWTHIRKREFALEGRRLLQRAHHFRLRR
jgi:hypothetical protein